LRVEIKIRLFSINEINPYPENNERKMLNMTIHLSGRNADVFGKIIHVNEPITEIRRGILKMINFDLIKPTIPDGSKIAFITKNRIIRFVGL
jgi:hypothetical protein